MKKFVFVDLDGTILDFNTHKVPESTFKALELAREAGHEIILATGRPPGLFDGIDKELGFDNYIAANGRIVVFHEDIIYESPIPTSKIDKLVQICKELKVDLAYESMNEFILESEFSDSYVKFCNHFNLKLPKLQSGYYKNEPIYQICLFYCNDDFKRFEEEIPGLSFEYSAQCGIDVNTEGGFKDAGIKVYMEKLGLTQSDIIVIGDGFNDISMLQFADTSIAMGNAHDDVKKQAKFVTDDIAEDGFYKAFKRFGLLKKE